MVRRAILLDSGPLGLLTNPRHSPSVEACANWLRRLRRADQRVILPEIVDYELRRELLLRNNAKALKKLDEFCELLEYLPLSTDAMRLAAELWAKARQRGQPTAGDKSIDCDVILAAQVLTLSEPKAVIATSNVGHLARFVPAREWDEIEARL